MNEITFKIAKKGEGKTRWLLDVAHSYAKTDKPVYYCANLQTEYGNFCEKYFRTFQEICNVKELSLPHLDGDAVVLIDDMMTTNITPKDILYIQQNSYKLYVAITGITDTVEEIEPMQPHHF